GRLTEEKRTSLVDPITSARYAYLDFNGEEVTPTVAYKYNGLSNLSRTIQSGATGTLSRETSYQYGAGGRLGIMTDAEGFARTYRYDAAGRVTREEYSRQLAVSGSSIEGIGYDYDLEGRVIAQGAMVYLSSAWTRNGPGAGIDLD